jgi:hypothetical protein
MAILHQEKPRNRTGTRAVSQLCMVRNVPSPASADACPVGYGHPGAVERALVESSIALADPDRLGNRIPFETDLK